jgi:hypothetical protein
MLNIGWQQASFVTLLFAENSYWSLVVIHYHLRSLYFRNVKNNQCPNDY